MLKQQKKFMEYMRKCKLKPDKFSVVRLLPKHSN